MLFGILVPFTILGDAIGLVQIGFEYILLIFAVSILYCFIALFAKRIYIKKYGEWI